MREVVRRLHDLGLIPSQPSQHVVELGAEDSHQVMVCKLVPLDLETKSLKESIDLDNTSFEVGYPSTH
jgi:hypothetical protein